MSCLDAICVPPVLHKIQALPRSFDFPPPPTVNCFSLRMMIVIKEYEDKYNFVRDDVVFNDEEDADDVDDVDDVDDDDDVDDVDVSLISSKKECKLLS